MYRPSVCVAKEAPPMPDSYKTSFRASRKAITYFSNVAGDLRLQTLSVKTEMSTFAPHETTSLNCNLPQKQKHLL